LLEQKETKIQERTPTSSFSYPHANASVSLKLVVRTVRPHPRTQRKFYF